jgi:hypothetical protein
VDGETEHVADADRGVSPIYDAASQPHMAAFRERLGKTAGLHHAGEPQELVNAQALAFSHA